jgi:uncharacterized protein YqhQ
MEKSKPKEMTAKQRKQFRLAMYSCGVASIVLGAFFAFVVPEILGEDPEIYRILGGLTVLLSFPEFWLGYRHGRVPEDETGSDPVFNMKD